MQSSSNTSDRRDSGQPRHNNNRDERQGSNTGYSAGRQQRDRRDQNQRSSRLTGAKVPNANASQNARRSNVPGQDKQQQQGSMQSLRKPSNSTASPSVVAAAPQTNTDSNAAQQGPAKSWAALLSPQKPEQPKTASKSAPVSPPHQLQSLGPVKGKHATMPSAEAIPEIATSQPSPHVEAAASIEQPTPQPNPAVPTAAAPAKPAESPPPATHAEAAPAANPPNQPQQPKSWASLLANKKPEIAKPIIVKKPLAVEVPAAAAKSPAKTQELSTPQSPPPAKDNVEKSNKHHKNKDGAVTEEPIKQSKEPRPKPTQKHVSVQQPAPKQPTTMPPVVAAIPAPIPVPARSVAPAMQPVLAVPTPTAATPHGFAFQRGGGVVIHHPMPSHGMMPVGAPMPMVPMSVPPHTPYPGVPMYTSVPMPGAMPVGMHPPWGMHHHVPGGPMMPGMHPMGYPVTPLPPGAVPPPMPGHPHMAAMQPQLAHGIPVMGAPVQVAIPQQQQQQQQTAYRPVEQQRSVEAATAAVEAMTIEQQPVEPKAAEVEPEQAQPPIKTAPKEAEQTESVVSNSEQLAPAADAAPATAPAAEQPKEEPAPMPIEPLQPMSWAARAKAAAGASPPADHKPHPVQKLPGHSPVAVKEQPKNGQRQGRGQGHHQRQDNNKQHGGRGRQHQGGDNRSPQHRNTHNNNTSSKGHVNTHHHAAANGTTHVVDSTPVASPKAAAGPETTTTGTSQAEANGIVENGVAATPAPSSNHAAQMSAAAADAYADAATAIKALCSDNGAWLKCGPENRVQPRGISNPGNLCFMNSVLQALLGSNAFCKLMRALEAASPVLDNERTPTLFGLAQLAAKLQTKEDVKQLESKKSVDTAESSKKGGKNNTAHVLTLGGQPFAPTLLMDIVHRFDPRRKRGPGAEQEDASEFLEFIFEAMHQELLLLQKEHGMAASAETPTPLSHSEDTHEDGLVDEDGDEWLTKSGKRSVRRQEVGTATTEPETAASTLFQGKVASSVACTGAPTSVTVQPFTVLGLHIHSEQVHAVADALDELTASEKVQDYKPAGASEATTATKTLRLQKLPHLLALHLMRFEFSFDRSSKLTKAVSFEPKMTIRSSWLSAGSKDRGAEYQLVATVSHHGKNITSGHYTADVLQHDGRWLRFDDGNVCLVSQQVVLADRPYLLFYARSNLHDVARE